MLVSVVSEQLASPGDRGLAITPRPAELLPELPNRSFADCRFAVGSRSSLAVHILDRPRRPHMISALAWVPRGAAKPVQDEPLLEEDEPAALEVMVYQLLRAESHVSKSQQNRLAHGVVVQQEGGEVQPNEADGLESEGEGSESDVDMDEAAQIAQAKAMAAAVKAKPIASKGLQL